jgi:hypothetical protein
MSMNSLLARELVAARRAEFEAAAARDRFVRSLRSPRWRMLWRHLAPRTARSRGRRSVPAVAR